MMVACHSGWFVHHRGEYPGGIVACDLLDTPASFRCVFQVCGNSSVCVPTDFVEEGNNIPGIDGQRHGPVVFVTDKSFLLGTKGS
jgi:hypothetical protein